MKSNFSILVAVLSILLLVAPTFAQRNRDYTALYRLYNSKTGDRLYTTDCNEKENVLRTGSYAYEGVAGYVAKTQMRRTIPLYRLFLSNGRHFYTIDNNEVNSVQQQNYGNKNEGIAGYVSERQTRDTLPFYRLLNNGHFYTTNEQEKNVFVQNGGKFENIAGYLFISGENFCDYGTSAGGQYGAPTLYAGTNFDGAAQALEGDQSDLNDWDGSPHTIRSIRVPQGWYLVVYTKKNYGGKSYNISSDITFAPGDQWYNKIRSIKIYRGNPPIQPR
jgi:Repeat of unknown function (DUF5648)/Beta/Gamma crystallin